jgi:hypothetical protein
MRRFAAPALAEVAEYFASLNSSSDPARFFDYYTANGWRVGRSPMRDWRAAARNWSARDKAPASSPVASQSTRARSLADDLTDKSWANR